MPPGFGATITGRDLAMLWGFVRNRTPTWVYDYVRLPPVIVILIYAQVGCALIGSLGEQYNGVLLMNFVIALFALVALESNSHNLCRAYMFLHFFAILLDISWFIFFFIEIWNISSEKDRSLYIYSVKLTMAMEIAGFVIKLSSSVLWFRIYRQGASTVDTSLSRQSDSDLRNSFLEPPPVIANQRSRSEEILRKSFHEPANHSPRVVDEERHLANQRSRSEEILRESFQEPANNSPLIVDGERNLANQRSRSEEVIGHHTTAAEASRSISPLLKSLESLQSSLQ